MNKIEIKEEVNGKVEKKGQEEKINYLFQSNQSFEIILEIEENQSVEVFHYGKDCSGKIKIFLKGKSAKVVYHYNTVNEEDHHIQVDVFHQAEKTTSQLFFHGYNAKEHQLTFQIDVHIPKGMKDAKANQENRIYNHQDGISTILPNLYIDEYDVEANHASYIGPFDQNMQFYLQSRGLKKEVVERLLLEGFLIQEGLTEEEKVSFFQIRKEGSYES